MSAEQAAGGTGERNVAALVNEIELAVATKGLHWRGIAEFLAARGVLVPNTLADGVADEQAADGTGDWPKLDLIQEADGWYSQGPNGVGHQQIGPFATRADAYDGRSEIVLLLDTRLAAPSAPPSEPLAETREPTDAQRLEWVATALHGDPMFGRGAFDPLVQQVNALRAASAPPETDGGDREDAWREAIAYASKINIQSGYAPFHMGVALKYLRAARPSPEPDGREPSPAPAAVWRAAFAIAGCNLPSRGDQEVHDAVCAGGEWVPFDDWKHVAATVLRAASAPRDAPAADGGWYALCSVCNGRSAVDKSYPCRPCGSRGVVRAARPGVR